MLYYGFKITGIYLHDVLNTLQICVHSLMDILHSCPHPALQVLLGGGEARAPSVDIWGDVEAAELFAVCEL